MGIYVFENKRPEIGQGTYIHPEAVLIGSVKVGPGCFIGAGAVLRGDFGEISIGRGSNVQENAVLHATPLTPVLVEDDVIVAHGALLHDTTIGRGAVIGMGAIILHNARVEEEAVVGAGSVVAPGTIVEARTIVMGNPAKFHKKLSEDQLEVTRLGLAMYQELPARYLKGAQRLDRWGEEGTG